LWKNTQRKRIRRRKGEDPGPGEVFGWTFLKIMFVICTETNYLDSKIGQRENSRMPGRENRFESGSQINSEKAKRVTP
jgi:hypothetical protein